MTLYDVENNIFVSYSTFDFDVKYDNVNTHKNIENHNKKKVDENI